MSDKIEIPIDTGFLVLKRKERGMRNSSIGIGTNGEIIPNGSKRQIQYKVAVRKVNTNKEISPKAKKLQTCKGLSGCEFVECAKEVFGKLPPNLVKLESNCPTLKGGK